MEVYNNKGLGNIFQVIAVMDGDYDDGGSRVDVAKTLFGEVIFEDFQGMFPSKYKRLVELNKDNE